MGKNDLMNNTYYAKVDVNDTNTVPNKDDNSWTCNTTGTYFGGPYYEEKTNVPYFPWGPQKDTDTNPYDTWKKSENWPNPSPTIPNSPFNPLPNSPFNPLPTLPTEPKVDQNLQNLINRLQTELAEQTEELNKIARKCDRISKNNKKLKKENEELEKRNKKLNKFSRFDIIDIEDNDEN